MASTANARRERSELRMALTQPDCSCPRIGHNFAQRINLLAKRHRAMGTTTPLLAADICCEHKLAAADAIVYATARTGHGCTH